MPDTRPSPIIPVAAAAAVALAVVVPAIVAQNTMPKPRIILYILLILCLACLLMNIIFVLKAKEVDHGLMLRIIVGIFFIIVITILFQAF